MTFVDGRDDFDIGGNAGCKSASADGDEYEIGYGFGRFHQFLADRSVAGNDFRIVEGMNKGHAAAIALGNGFGISIVEGVAGQG